MTFRDLGFARKAQGIANTQAVAPVGIFDLLRFGSQAGAAIYPL